MSSPSPKAPLPPRTNHLLQKASDLLESGQAADAVECLRQAAAQAPDTPEVMERLAEAYEADGQVIPALRTYDRLIEIGAATASIWRATGNALTSVGEYAQAIGAYEQSLELDPVNPEAHNNLGQVRYRLGEVDRAAEHLEAATAQSDSINPWVSLATIIPGCPHADLRKIKEVRGAYAARLAELYPGSDQEPWRSERSSGDRLRVGYLSAYFHGANYMKPVWGLINHHDRNSFEIHLFSDRAATEISGYESHPQDRIHETADLDNRALSEFIREHRIDVLVDLNAYSTPERLPLFLGRPAPVTIAWFNMYATSGLPGFSYLIGDREVARAEEEPFFTEKLLYLPLSYLTFEVQHPAPPVAPPPCLRNGLLTFGSLVSQYKITLPVLDAWTEILRQAPDSRLLLANSALKSPHNREYVAERFAERGVDPERLGLLGPADHLTFLRYYDAIDIALDAFPYNGGTTTMEALWQGVPVLTFDGDRWASRTSQSLIRNTHLGEFVADDVRGYVQLAVEMAKAPDIPRRLSGLRRSMRGRLRQSSACDTSALAANMERLYRAVWDEQTALPQGI